MKKYLYCLVVVTSDKTTTAVIAGDARSKGLSLSKVLEQGWIPVRESPMGGAGQRPCSLVLLEKESSGSEPAVAVAGAAAGAMDIPATIGEPLDDAVGLEEIVDEPPPPPPPKPTASKPKAEVKPKVEAKPKPPTEPAKPITEPAKPAEGAKPGDSDINFDFLESIDD